MELCGSIRRSQWLVYSPLLRTIEDVLGLCGVGVFDLNPQNLEIGSRLHTLAADSVEP
jgi:hypothetical protein